MFFSSVLFSFFFCFWLACPANRVVVEFLQRGREGGKRLFWFPCFFLACVFCPMVEALAIILFMAVELTRTVVESDSYCLVAARARCVVVRAVV